MSWTDVRESLPVDNGTVLAAVVRVNGTAFKRLSADFCVARWFSDPGKWVEWTEGQMGPDLKNENVIAWMPLPAFPSLLPTNMEADEWTPHTNRNCVPI